MNYNNLSLDSALSHEFSKMGGGGGVTVKGLIWFCFKAGREFYNITTVQHKTYLFLVTTNTLWLNHCELTSHQ